MKNTATTLILRAMGLMVLTALLSPFGFGSSDVQFKKDSLTQGYKIIEGDIQVPEGPELYFTYATNFWTNGVVPFEFDANVTQANRNAMIAAMSDWENVTAVDFRFRNGEGNFIHVQDSTGNNSAIGMRGGQQIINIVSWGSRFIIVHELGHALGMWHEQSRPDRDTFVRINTANIQAGQAGQFERRADASIYGPYDFDSVMHYDRCSFSIDCPAGATCNCTNDTITVLAPNNATWQNQIGQRDHLSYLDRVTMSFLYPRGDWRFVDQFYTGGNEDGSFRRPFRELRRGIDVTPVGGTLWIQPGTYTGFYNKAITLQAPLGNVTLR